MILVALVIGNAALYWKDSILLEEIRLEVYRR